LIPSYKRTQLHIPEVLTVHSSENTKCQKSIYIDHTAGVKLVAARLKRGSVAARSLRLLISMHPGARIYSGTSVHERLSSRTNRFMNKFSEQKTSRVTNGVSRNEHASRQQRLATSWEYRRESVSCCVIFAQYTSLLEFPASSLEFHCVCVFLKYIIK
jgi:hypothetical protein